MVCTGFQKLDREAGDRSHKSQYKLNQGVIEVHDSQWSIDCSSKSLQVSVSQSM